MKKMTCGVVIITPENKILLGHSTGNVHWDVFKGIKEDYESTLRAAQRETKEETGLIINESELKFIGQFPYNRHKIIVLYGYFPKSININSLKCDSMVNIEGQEPFPEIDNYKSFEYGEALENMSMSLKNLFIKQDVYQKSIKLKELCNKKTKNFSNKY